MLLQKMARSLKFRIKEEKELFYPRRENKGDNLPYSYCTADLGLRFRIDKIRFAHDAAHISNQVTF